MPVPASVQPFLCCPTCHGSLAAEGGDLVCRRHPEHRFPFEDGFLTFADLPRGKYEDTYAARYAGLWAYGYQSRHSGLNESLYRTVSSLVAEHLTARESTLPPLVVDAGCGVGRIAADCAALAPSGQMIAVDGALSMLRLANRIGLGTEPVEIDLPHLGFGRLTIPARGVPNLFLARADVLHLPLVDGCADVALSVNIIDRLPVGPAAAFAECHRILRPGGRLVFTDPLNWQEPELWRTHGDRDAILAEIDRCGFTVDIWFDDLIYREVMDARGSVEEFRTLVVSAVKSDLI